MKWPVVDLNNKKVEEITLNELVFGGEIRTDIMHRVVRWQLAKRQAGTHQTKGISGVSGSTKKPFRQKGTGRARQGTIRAPQMRGGGIVFGPQVRDHSHDLPKKVRKLGLRSALASKIAQKNFVVVDSFKGDEFKTKNFAALLEKNGWSSVLFIDGTDLNQPFVRAARNIVGVDVLAQQGANVHSILKRTMLVLSKDAVHHLEARLA
ncbi:MAG: 50S ribosomal protein L4 [Alphaproteobacteria bacterium]|nr:50S ribosomal protein L4 [Alphaproteobacteria bacterium]